MSHGPDNPYREQCGCWECMPDLSDQAEMRELGPCGHPKMFQEKESEMLLDSGTGKVCHIIYRCTICEEIRLERAAALRMAADVPIPYKAQDDPNDPDATPVDTDTLRKNILSLIPASDASALDEAIRLAVEKALKAAMGARNEYPYRVPLSDAEMLGLKSPAGDTKPGE